MNKSILVVDDNLTICLMLKSWLNKRGFNVETATHAEKARQMVKNHPFDLILSDIRMPDIDGFKFLSWLKKFDSDILIIMMTEYAGIESAVESMKLGAEDYIPKPIDPETLFRKIDEAFQVQENNKKNSRFTYDFLKPPGKENDQLFKQLNLIAENNTHSLILGDRGTGKASAVKYVYEKGIHYSKPLVMLDANDLTYKNQSFFSSGDESVLIEKLNAAEGGLFYIREIDQLNKPLQNELLDIITKQKKDEKFTQIILSSEKNIDELQDILIPKLFNLLKKDCVILPSLKGRDQQIIFFATYFLKYANFILNKEIESVDPIIQKKFIQHEWPGNIQELKNSVIKAALLTDGNVISAVIAPHLFDNKISKTESLNISLTNIQSLRKENYEREKICQALELAKGNKTMAASILNIDRKTLYNKIKLYKITAPN